MQRDKSYHETWIYTTNQLIYLFPDTLFSRRFVNLLLYEWTNILFSALQGENATFAYGLIGAESKFTVASTGYILVSGAIDREAKDRYHLEVQESLARCRDLIGYWNLLGSFRLYEDCEKKRLGIRLVHTCEIRENTSVRN